MSLLVPSEGELLLLEYMLNKTAPVDPILRIYSNNYVPVDGSVYADFTETTVAGYVPFTFVGANWSVGTTTSITSATYSTQNFTFSTTATVYGYYITKGSSNVLWAERFSGAPFVLPGAGGEISISPKITAD